MPIGTANPQCYTTLRGSLHVDSRTKGGGGEGGGSDVWDAYSGLLNESGGTEWSCEYAPANKS